MKKKNIFYTFKMESQIVRKILQAEKSIRQAHKLLQDAKEKQQKLDTLQASRLKKESRIKQLFSAHHKLYDKAVDAQIQKKHKINNAMILVRKEIKKLEKDIEKILHFYKS